MKKLTLALLIVLLATTSYATIRSIDAQTLIARELKNIRQLALQARVRADVLISKMNNLKSEYSDEVDATDGVNLQGILSNLTTMRNDADIIVNDIDTDFPTIQE